MNRGLKITLITVGVFLGVAIIAGIAAYVYFKFTFLDFEGDYAEKPSLIEVTIDGYSFKDRNANGQLDIYEDERRSTDERVEDLLSQMTMDEKIHLLKGSGIASAMGGGDGVIPGAVGTIVPTPRLGLPTVYLSDGPAGLRIQPTREDGTYYCTAFPIGTLLSSTWNTELVKEVGHAMGNEALEYGIDVILGPGANIHRHPFCGRNFEYYSEDPVLTGFIGAAMVNGIESNGVGASVKHYVANNQETNRNFNDVIVSERAMREIYLKGFEIIVKQSQPWTIMSSYNRVNGTYVAESEYLLTQILRNEWGFEGLVMSDWFGGQDAVSMVSAGNDLLEPGTKRQWNALLEGHENGTLTEGAINSSVRRILAMILQSRKMQGYVYGNDPDLDTHAEVTRRSAAEGIVLLKNNETLPLRGVKNVALLGVTSYDFIAGGTGSGDVNEAYSVSLEEGLKNQGIQGMENQGFEINAAAKEAFETHRRANEEAFVKPEGMDAMFNPYTPPELVYTRDQLVEIEAGADIAIITIGRNSGEGGDRVAMDDFLLSTQEKNMITTACEVFHAAGKKVIVVLNIGGVVETASWKEQPDAILLAWQGGQEGGNSVADILNGQVNPSGKLPMTFPVNLEDHASHANFPLNGEPWNIMTMLSGGDEVADEDKERNKDYTLYEEGIYVGYRHFDKAKLEVSYPFGFGLSYTTFALDSMHVMLDGDSVVVSVSATNTGTVAGKEVIQVYVSVPNSGIDRPIQELKSFVKTPLLAPGESRTMLIRIPVDDMQYWDEDRANWTFENGTYQIKAGVSSRDIRTSTEMVLMR